MDVSPDVSTTCDPAVCDQMCSATTPGAFGACRTDGCHCFGGNQADASIGTDASSDVPATGILSCTSNADCPEATTFCNGPGCGTPGFCYPRMNGAGDDAGCAASGPRQCGCDGQWYESSCARQMAGVRLAPVATCGGDVDAG